MRGRTTVDAAERRRRKGRRDPSPSHAAAPRGPLPLPQGARRFARAATSPSKPNRRHAPRPFSRCVPLLLPKWGAGFTDVSPPRSAPSGGAVGEADGGGSAAAGRVRSVNRGALAPSGRCAATSPNGGGPWTALFPRWAKALAQGKRRFACVLMRRPPVRARPAPGRGRRSGRRGSGCRSGSR